MNIEKLKKAADDISLSRGERRRAKREIMKFMKAAPVDEKKQHKIHVRMRDGTTLELYRSMTHMKDLKRRNEPIRFVLEGEMAAAGESRFRRFLRRIKQFLFSRKYKLGKNNERGLLVKWEDVDSFYAVK